MQGHVDDPQYPVVRLRQTRTTPTSRDIPTHKVTCIHRAPTYNSPTLQLTALLPTVPSRTLFHTASTLHPFTSPARTLSHCSMQYTAPAHLMMLATCLSVLLNKSEGRMKNEGGKGLRIYRSNASYAEQPHRKFVRCWVTTG